MSVKLPNLQYATVSATASLTGLYDEYIVSVAATTVLTLPAAADILKGRTLSFKRQDTTSNVVTIAPAAGDTINSASSSLTLALGDDLQLVGDGVSNWILVGSSAARLASVTGITGAQAVTNSFSVYTATTLGGASAWTLPLASAAGVGRAFYFRANAAVATITAAGSDTIDGGATFALANPGSAMLVCTSSTTWTVALKGV